MFNFEDNIGILVLKMITWKKQPPVSEGFFFQIWSLGTELWDKILKFEDNIGLT